MIKELLKGSGNWHGIKAGICPILGDICFFLFTVPKEI